VERHAQEARRREACAVACALLVACAAPSAAPPAPLRLSYAISLVGPPAPDEAVERSGGRNEQWLASTPTLVVEVRAATPLPAGRWVLDAPDPAVRVELDGEVTALGPDGTLDLPEGTRSLRYRVPLAGGAIAGSAYLLRPAVTPPAGRATLTFAGASPLLPWTDTRDLPIEALGRDAYHVFGGRRLEARAGPTELALAILGELAVEDEALREWAARSVAEAMTLTTAPPPRLTLAVIAVAGDGIPFGMERSGSVMVLVGERAGPEALRRDWVLVHELAHVALPYVEDALWLREGLASYYQQVLRLRSGRLTPDEAWGGLRDGAREGAARADGLDLSTLSAELHARHAYLPVYWGGAMVALELDLELRRAGSSLDAALRSLRERVVRLEALRAVIDAVVPGAFERVVARHLEGPALARAPALLERLRDDGPDADLRRAIGAP
jgi:hypothetical protein